MRKNIILSMMVIGAFLFATPHFLSAAKKQAVKKTKEKKDAEKDIFQWFQTYSEVVSIVEQKAFRTVDFSRFIQDSLKSAVAQVDAHSAFFTKESYKAALESTQGEFSGIGVSVVTKNPEDESLVIVDVIQDGPGFKAGLEAGDKIVEVNGEKLKGLSSDEVINKLKGKTGSTLNLKIIRKKKPLEFTVTRDVIKDQTSICYRFPNQDVYYVSLKIFNEVAAQQVKDILHKANDGECKGLILDLRRNPGGTLDSAIEMAGLFLNRGSVVVSTKDRNRKRIANYVTDVEPVLESDVPVFILVDNFTASASEILAGCLKYHSMKTGSHKNLMVFLVGTPTFGKGSVQELMPIKNGTALKLTTMLYYLPEDQSIQAVGIKPDFTIQPKTTPSKEMKWINELYGKESSLKNHITVDEVEGKDSSEKPGFWGRLFGRGKKKVEAKKKKEEEDKKKTFEQKQKEALSKDIQVQAAVNMINLLDIAKRNMPKLVAGREKAVAFLKKNYLTDDKVEVVKVK